MTSSSKIFYLLLLLGLIFSLTGCELARSGDAAGDMSPLQALPPTLAPLGSENSPLTAEATAVPTVLSVPATPAQANSAIANPVELVAPTAPPTDLAANNNQVQPTPTSDSPAPTAPAATPAPSIVVSAATSESLPQGGPVAINPPASNPSGVIPAASNGGTYTVQAGDTLFAISQRYGTSVEALVSANGLNSDMVQVGQTLTIPGDSAAPAPSSDPVPAAQAAPLGANGTYVVTSNDTLFSIAQRYGTTVEAIAGANNIRYPYIIYDGQMLTIPTDGAAPVMPSTANGAYPQQPTQGYYAPNQDYPYTSDQEGYSQPVQGYYAPNQGYPSQEGYAATHTVAAGETLYSIARRYGVSPQVIASANGLTDPNQIFVGQVLYLP